MGNSSRPGRNMDSFIRHQGHFKKQGGINMAPDKIYVREYQDGYYSTCWDEKPHELAHELESIGMKTEYVTSARMF